MGFIRSVSLTFGNQIIINLLSLASNVILARMLGASGKGQIAAAIAIYSIAMQVVHFGVGQGIVFTGARGLEQAKRSALSALIFSFLNGALGVFLLIFIAGTKTGFTKNVPQELIYYLACALPFALLSTYLGSLLLATERIFLMNLVSFSSEAVRLLGFLTLLFTDTFSVKNVVAIWLISMVTTSLLSFILVAKNIGFARPGDLSHFRMIITIGIRYFFIDVIGFLLLRSDILLLNYFKSSADVGIYSIAVTIADKALLIPQIIGVILLPKVIKQKDEILQFQAKVSRFTSFILLPALLFVALIGWPAIFVLLGREFLSSYIPLLILLPGIYFLGLNSILGSYFVARAYPPICFIAPAFGLFVNIIGNIFLIPVWGYNAAALTSTIGYALMYGVYIFQFRRETGIGTTMMIVPKWDEVKTLYQQLKVKILTFRTTIPIKEPVES